MELTSKHPEKTPLYIKISSSRVGYVDVTYKTTLAQIRQLIQNTFDDAQKEVLTRSFSFLYNGFIISKKQEPKLAPMSFLHPKERDGGQVYILDARPKITKDSFFSSSSSLGAADEISTSDPSLLQPPAFPDTPRSILSEEPKGEVEEEFDCPAEEMAMELPPAVLSSAYDRKHLKIKTSQDEFFGDDFSGERDAAKEKRPPSRFENLLPAKKITLAGLPEGVKTISLGDVKDLSQTPETPFWLDVQGASHEEIGGIGKVFDVHPLTIEDISMRDSREKLEIFGHYLLVIFYSEHYIMEKNVNENPICLLLFSSFIISFHNDPENSIVSLSHKIAGLPSKSIRSPSWILYAILDSVVDDLIPVTDKVLNEILNVEEIGHTFGAEDHNEFLARVSKTRRNITLLRQRLWPKQNMLSNMLRKTYRKFMRDVSLPYFRDCLEHISKMINSLEIQHENLNNIQSMFLAKVSLEVAESSHKLDKVAKRFGTFATIMLPLTFVTGLLGMNVTIPFQSTNAENDPHSIAFCVICGVLFISGVGVALYFKKRELM